MIVNAQLLIEFSNLIVCMSYTIILRNNSMFSGAGCTKTEYCYPPDSVIFSCSEIPRCLVLLNWGFTFIIVGFKSVVLLPFKHFCYN